MNKEKQSHIYLTLISHF